MFWWLNVYIVEHDITLHGNISQKIPAQEATLQDISAQSVDKIAGGAILMCTCLSLG